MVCVRKPISLAFTGGERELGKSPGQIPGGPVAKVRARKPISLAFTGGEREPEKSPEQIPGGPAAKVRARKPISLAFMGGEREPEKSPEQIPGARPASVCVRKPNSVGLRASVRKPAPGHRPVTGVSAGRSLRTKTEFSGFAGWRTQTGRTLRPGSGGADRPWFAYENRIHWLSKEAYANREAPEAGFGRGRTALVCVRKPNSLACRRGVRKPGGP